MALSKILFSILAISFSTNLWSQEQSYNLRSLNVTVGDTMIKTQALNNVPKKLKLINAPYHWFYAGKIQVNYGGYSGKLIHGKFEAFDKNSQLIEQGYFNYGLKQGLWNEWYPNGFKKKSIEYDDGYPDGLSLLFDKRGRLLSKQSFHKGRLDGKSVYYSPDTIIEKDYKNGKEIIKKKKVQKEKAEKKIKPKLEIKKGAEKKDVEPKLKTKEDKATNDSVQTSKRPRKLFFNNVKKQNVVKDEKG